MMIFLSSQGNFTQSEFVDNTYEVLLPFRFKFALYLPKNDHIMRYVYTQICSPSIGFSVLNSSQPLPTPPPPLKPFILF